MLTKLYQSIRTIALSAALFAGVALVVAPSQVAMAAPVDVLTKCDSGSKVCAGTDKNSLFDLMRNVINLLLAIVGIIAVIMIIIGGIRYTTSAGDAGQTKSARDTIVYAVAGVVIAIMSYAIVNFVLTKL